MRRDARVSATCSFKPAKASVCLSRIPFAYSASIKPVLVRARPICRDFGCSDTVGTMGICPLILRELHVSPLGKPGSERHFSSSTGDGKNYRHPFCQQ